MKLTKIPSLFGLLLATTAISKAATLPPHKIYETVTDMSDFDDDDISLNNGTLAGLMKSKMHNGGRPKVYTFQNTPVHPTQLDKVVKRAFARGECEDFCEANYGHWACHPNYPWPMTCLGQSKKYRCGEPGKPEENWWTAIEACKDPRIDANGYVKPQNDATAAGYDHPIPVPEENFLPGVPIPEDCRDQPYGADLYYNCRNVWQTQRCCAVYSTWQEECLEVQKPFTGDEWCGGMERGLHTLPDGEWAVPDNCAVWRIQDKKCLVPKRGYPGDYIDIDGRSVHGDWSMGPGWYRIPVNDDTMP
ncbi:hypothetical protein AC578_7624 [Pseudocercospora eumusae]|uniref:Uncharacterized protein n=1 Tax=Pseudocercospora eumusae TaxID=321146 RepID=A0A139GX55_9PEZI|nr:hypothetical protein AC578_7624 [Pseudocercospora eumusae]